MKTIFVSFDLSHGSRQRSIALANNDNDPAGGAVPVVLPVPATDEQIPATAAQPHPPWRIQGMRNAL